MLEKAKGYGYRKVGFILDRGCFSIENIHYMDKCGYDFVIMMKGMKSLVSELILENKGSFEEERSYSIRQYKSSGKTIKRRLFASVIMSDISTFITAVEKMLRKGSIWKPRLTAWQDI